MAFVYKYSNPEGLPVYIGKCAGDSFLDLAVRLNGHRKDSWWSADYSVSYIDGLTPCDVDALETVLIGKYSPEFNKAKRWGEPSLMFTRQFQWVPLDLQSFSSGHPYAENVEALTCASCHSIIDLGKDFFFSISSKPSFTNASIDRFLCQACADAFKSDLISLYESYGLKTLVGSLDSITCRDHPLKE